MILSLNTIKKSFGDELLFDNITFHINEGEKVGLIGVNGAGKTTLCRIIQGSEPYDSGDITVKKGAHIGYLSQHEELDSDLSLYEEMLLSKKDIILMEERIQTLSHEISSCQDKDKQDALLREYDSLQNEFLQKDGFSYKSEVTGVLKNLGFSEEEFQNKVNTFSGGQKTRLALGKLLLASPDLLILDEPTNHLDLKGTLWLENYIKSYKNAVMLISHDRYFLDKCVNKIVEIREHTCIDFKGNYTEFAQKKQALDLQRIKEYENNQKEIKHQEDVIAKLKSFNRQKSIKRAESREKLLEKMEKVEKPQILDKKIHFTLTPKIESGNDVLSVKDLSMVYGNRTLFSGLSMDIKKKERVAVIGSNGIGKTTLMKIINGNTKPTSGRMVLGSRVNIGYYDQEQQQLSEDKNVFEEISDSFPDLDNTAIRTALASFLFIGDDVFKQVKDLSGGERGRLCLARLMLGNSNFLILDEPTNHLDIYSKEVLESVLSNYQGTVLFVSHDRYFINAVATRILNMTEEGVFCYEGNYDYFIEHMDTPSASLSSKGVSITSKNDQKDVNSKEDFMEQKRLQSERRRRENMLKKTEDRIEEIEDRLSYLDNILTREDIYTDSQKLLEIHQEKEELSKEMEELLMTWEDLA